MSKQSEIKYEHGEHRAINSKADLPTASGEYIWKNADGTFETLHFDTNKKNWVKDFTKFEMWFYFDPISQ